MAKEFTYTDDGQELRAWAESEADVVEQARKRLDEQSVSIRPMSSLRSADEI